MTILSRSAIRALAAVAFCALVPSSFAAAETIQLPFSMKKGDAFQLDVLTDTISKRGGGAKRVTREEHGDVTVISVRSDGYDVDVTLRDTKIHDAASGSDDFERSVAHALKNRPVRLSLNARGAPIAVRNWRSIVETVAQIGRRSLPQDVSPEGIRTFDAMIARLENMDDAAAAALVGKNLALWAFWHGEEIESDAVEVLDSFGHAGVSGESVAMKTEVRLERMDAETLTIQSVTTTDPDDLRAATIATLRSAIRDRGQRAKAIEHFSTAEIEQTFEQVYVIDRVTGWTRSVEQTRRSVIGGLSDTVEKTRITVTRR